MKYLAALPVIALMLVLDILITVTILLPLMFLGESDYPFSYGFAKRVWS